MTRARDLADIADGDITATHVKIGTTTDPSAGGSRIVTNVAGGSFAQFSDSQTNSGVTLGTVAGSGIFYTHSGAIGSETYTERLRILPTGGITFNGDTAAANALDDYEEGALSLSSSTGTASFVGNRYTKIGNQVTVRFYVNGFSDLSTATAIIITGLPYASSSSNHAVQGILGTFANTISGDAYAAYVGPSSSSLIFFKAANNVNYNQIQHAHLTSASAQFVVTLTYETA